MRYLIYIVLGIISLVESLWACPIPFRDAGPDCIYTGTLSGITEKPPDTQLIALNVMGKPLSTSDFNQTLTIRLDSGRELFATLSVIYQPTIQQYCQKLKEIKAYSFPDETSSILLEDILCRHQSWYKLFVNFLDVSPYLKQKGIIASTFQEFVPRKKGLERIKAILDEAPGIPQSVGDSSQSTELVQEATRMTLERIKIIKKILQINQEIAQVNRAIFKFLTTGQYYFTTILKFGNHHLMRDRKLRKRHLKRYQIYGMLILNIRSVNPQTMKPPQLILADEKSLPTKTPELSATPDDLKTITSVDHRFTTDTNLASLIDYWWENYLKKKVTPEIFCTRFDSAFL